jgi:hypothetical protein
MKKDKRKFRCKKVGLVALVLIVMFSFASCNIITNLAGLLIHSATETLYNFIASYFDTDDPDNAIYGSENDLAVGFSDGKMTAFWDDYGYYSYNLNIDNAGTIESYDIEDNQCNFDLVEKGYDYSDNLNISLYGTNQVEENTLLASYGYNGINENQYKAYTANMDGGWEDLDRYVATRYELFEMFNYIIIFQPDMVVKTEEDVSYHCSEVTLFLGYDYLSIYPQGTTIEDAYSTEIASAISAFDDSAGYNYSHTLEQNYLECTIFLRFSYEAVPTFTTNTSEIYRQSNFGLDSETPHYVLANIPRKRDFYIDSVENTVSVKTTDQLYFALKRGYRPICVAGSNAEYIYNYMRNILARINAEIISDSQKMHNIYDYIVDTVIYDYEFVENVINNEEMTNSNFFLYKCLYMEGVFGFTNEKTFEPSSCVAICDGIAKAVLSMCTIEGIPVIKVSGNSDGVAHAWNKVQIKGSWYLVDATWGNVRKQNSKVESLSHDYLMASDDINHIEDKWVKYPSAPRAFSK